MNAGSAVRGITDWCELSLGPGGRSVIEASAGTGKTWTIAALYLRLLLEEGMTPRQVVVATFTDAAASELRERLRARLLSAEALARDATLAPGPDDGVAIWLHKRWEQDGERRAIDLNRLRLAMAELDQAPVGTLHGLCARILREQPFAAGSAFEAGELVDGSLLIRELDADFKRLRWQGDAGALDAWMPREVQAGLASEKIGPSELAALLKPGTDIDIGEEPAWPDDQLPDQMRSAVGAIKGTHKKLIRGWLAAAAYIDGKAGEPPGKDELDAMRAGELSKAISKTGANHPYIGKVIESSVAVADFIEARIEHQRLRLWKHLRDWALAHKQAWMQRHGRRSFDDLLLDVYGVLESEQGADTRPLADALHAAWPVALVDEFQDTDGLQYGILDAIYRDAAGAPRGRLVMIGDPKQAIYGFRGGDIHTYQRAAASADERLVLQVNQRSSRAYVAAMNRYFELVGDQLDAGEGASSGIRYQSVQASGRRDKTPYESGADQPAQALHVHYLDEVEAHQSRRVVRALRACANDIARMLASGIHRIGDKPIAPGDIAVLLPKGRDVLQLRQLLEARGVPCVTQARTSVFDTAAARDLQVILHGVWHVESLPMLRAALMTPLMGFDMAGIAALDAEPVAMQVQVNRFHAWRDLWRRRGVMALVHALIGDEGTRWLSGGAGERILTDVRHLGELLQVRMDAGDGPTELFDWLAEQRAGEGEVGEEARESRQLRIESEAPRVRLMTLHASKGLEFPVVFLPLMWAHGQQDAKGLVASHDDRDGRRLLRLGDAAREHARREQQDERFRVLYVAMTRAVHVCHVYALPSDRLADGSKGARPANQTGTARSPLDVQLARLPYPLGSPALAEVSSGIAWHGSWGDEGSIHLPKRDAVEAPRQVRGMLPGPFAALPSRHSFSTLTRGLPAADASQSDPADDESAPPAAVDAPGAIQSPPQDEHPQLLALSGVRGTGIGNALHAVLEQRVAGSTVSSQPALLRQALQAEGLWANEREGVRLAGLLAGRLDTVLATELADDMPALAGLPAANLRAELEFHFALDETSLARLRQACADHGAPGLVPAGERTLRGLMTGKIDLLFAHGGRFHVLDWKGNFLGTRVQDYCGASLGNAMADHRYGFQALLYTIALERHLRIRLPGYQRAHHLGDAWYLFVRAVGVSPGAGIWRHRFDGGLLDAVDAALPGIRLEVGA